MSEFSVGEPLISGGNNALARLLMAPDIQPGDNPSYQLCKEIFLNHPLGAKMVEAPIAMAQSQERDITVQDAPDEVRQAFVEEWQNLDADGNILNVHASSRIYGISALIVGVRGFPSGKPLEMDKIWNQDIYFHTLDPLNTSGSLVLSQSPNDPDFQKPTTVRAGGLTYHPSRFQVVMNERPIFISYTTSAFGFVGRSVYQRALFPLKSFIRSMVADDMILTKLGVFIVKQKQPGSIVNAVMMKIAAVKRAFIKMAQTWNVIQIGHEDDVSTIDMTNVAEAGTYARNNCIRNVETAADMPAKMLDQETMVSGFGEGTEDAKRYAQYINRIRIILRPTYKWFTNIVQYRAWNEQWYKSAIQSKYEQYKDVPFDVAFMEWRKNFVAEWPSLLIEPESEAVERSAVIFEAVLALLNSLIPILDPENKTKVIQWACDCFGENKKLFPHELELDWEALQEFQLENQERAVEQHDASIEPEEDSKKMRKLDASGNVTELLTRLNAAVARYRKPAPAKA